MPHLAPPHRARDSSPPPHRRHRTRLIAALSSAVIILIGVIGIVLPGNAVAEAPRTIVSLTFDNSNADQLAAEQTMEALGLHGTFYTISGYIDAPNYLTQTDLHAIAVDGNEIGGHTITHPDLTTLLTAEATRQVCNDRINLINWGFQVTSFAHPFAAATTNDERIAEYCGYTSTRGLGDIQTRFGCTNCAVAETVPPANGGLKRSVHQPLPLALSPAPLPEF
jgi:peptidoglycan/xylan/chitin deacetylase (PgdA/CDA1 family)